MVGRSSDIERRSARSGPRSFLSARGAGLPRGRCLSLRVWGALSSAGLGMGGAVAGCLSRLVAGFFFGGALFGFRVASGSRGGGGRWGAPFWGRLDGKNV